MSEATEKAMREWVRDTQEKMVREWVHDEIGKMAQLAPEPTKPPKENTKPSMATKEKAKIAAVSCAVGSGISAVMASGYYLGTGGALIAMGVALFIGAVFTAISFNL